MPVDAKKRIGTKDLAGPTSAAEHVTSGHRLYHFVAFGSTALLLLLVAATRGEQFAAVAGTILLGVSLEYVQHWVFHGALEWWDIRDDTIGVLLTGVICQWPPVRSTLVATPRQAL